VLPVVRSEGARAAARNVRVLVVSGSGTGAALMRRLVLEGYAVSAGALSLDDTDGAVASALLLPVRPVAPYARMSVEDESAVEALAESADVAVVVATPFGPENVGNLRSVVRSGAPTVLLGEMTPELDFTRGEALALWNKLADAGGRACADPRDVVSCIEEVRR
jgi:hypothetical protein